MATIILNDEEIEVEDGENICDAIEEAGVPIGCSNGVCGTCEIEVLEGMENLSELNQEEQDLGMEGGVVWQAAYPKELNLTGLPGPLENGSGTEAKRKP